MATTTEHMSQKQFNQISQHVSKMNGVSLLQIEGSISKYKNYIETLRKDLAILERGDHVGIQIQLLNKINQMEIDLMTKVQKDIKASYDIVGLQLQNERFCQEIQRKINEAQSSLDDLINIKAVFTEHYPEAHSSPRLSRQELENSPRRSISKDILRVSPKRCISKENSSVSNLMASPRRVKSKER
jgi:hypothetical protein